MDKKKVFLIILLCCLIGYFDFEFIIRAQLKSLNSVKPKVIKLKSDIETLNKELAAFQNLKLKQARLKEETSVNAKKIITQNELPTIIEQISSLANKNSVKIMEIKPVREQGGQDKGNIKAKFVPLSVAIDLFADYHRLGAFINDLENSPQLVEVDKLVIANEKTDMQQQKIDLGINVYVKE